MAQAGIVIAVRDTNLRELCITVVQDLWVKPVIAAADTLSEAVERMGEIIEPFGLAVVCDDVAKEPDILNFIRRLDGLKTQGVLQGHIVGICNDYECRLNMLAVGCDVIFSPNEVAMGLPRLI